MIETQLLPRGISDKKVIEAMDKVPRYVFVSKNFRENAYDDHPLPIGENQTISQPFMVAFMTELLSVSQGQKILEIGTGSGYQTAILAELTNNVYTIERIQKLGDKAKNTLDALGYTNVRFKIDDGTTGWPEEAPFDKIIVTAAASDIPETLFEQLAENGKLIIPVGARFSQELLVVEKVKGQKKITYKGGCVFVPLIGKFSTEKV